ncbi:hypothetical protein [Mesorhizobium sp. ANAO-SY3R2]|uniref:hypothetical protein n=1 Tax=Mesorhizobium sp. ANAO-SY3R2 TaxID=3166644 RepID=UPI00366C59ED
MSEIIRARFEDGRILRFMRRSDGYWFLAIDIYRSHLQHSPLANYAPQPSSVDIAAVLDVPLTEIYRRAGYFGLGRGRQSERVSPNAGIIREDALAAYLRLMGVNVQKAEGIVKDLLDAVKALAIDQDTDKGSDQQPAPPQEQRIDDLERLVREQRTSIDKLLLRLTRCENGISTLIREITSLKCNSASPSPSGSSDEFRRAASMLYAKAKQIEEAERRKRRG